MAAAPAKQGPQLVFLIGPAGVGKMTVGLELQRLTGLRLLHNRMTIDLVLPFFDFGTEAFGRLVSSFRTQIVEAVAESDLPGLLFTFVWAFDHPEDAKAIESYADIFRSRGLPVMFVELHASQQERLRRNRTELRLAHKVHKRDLAWSDANLIAMDDDYQLASPPEMRSRPDWLHIDTTEILAETTARLVIDHFDLAEIR